MEVNFWCNYYLRIRKERSMQLGGFSISLAVKDLNVSKEFYENYSTIIDALIDLSQP
mgnify:CR=1 FL=1